MIFSIDGICLITLSQIVFPQTLCQVLELPVALEIRTVAEESFPFFLLAPRALQLPFEYTVEENRILTPYRIINPEEENRRWRGLADSNGKRNTVEALVELARRISLHREIGDEKPGVRKGDARFPSQTDRNAVGRLSGYCAALRDDIAGRSA